MHTNSRMKFVTRRKVTSLILQHIFTLWSSYLLVAGQAFAAPLPSAVELLQSLCKDGRSFWFLDAVV